MRTPNAKAKSSTLCVSAYGHSARHRVRVRACVRECAYWVRTDMFAGTSVDGVADVTRSHPSLFGLCIRALSQGRQFPLFLRNDFSASMTSLWPVSLVSEGGVLHLLFVTRMAGSLAILLRRGLFLFRY